MQKQFEYKPFDRVTVDYNGAKMPGAIMCDLPDNWFTVCYESKAHRYLTNPFRVDQIRPGHYDADGNWLPQAGEPCHVILANGSPKNMVVVSAEAQYVAAIGEHDSERTICIKTAIGFVDGAWYFDMSESDAIPKSAFLNPGRIKIAE